MYAPSETAEVYLKGFTLFGLKDLLKTFMSDSSTASFKLARLLADSLEAHALCFQHFRQHLWDAVAAFPYDLKSQFWTLAMKVLKWRGYADDAALMMDIMQLQHTFAPRSDRVATLLTDLVNLRQKLCMFHVSKVFTMMRVASSVAESVHSAIKGGNEFSRLLKASNLYETLLHILSSMKVYVDDTVRDIQSILEKGYSYSRYVYTFLQIAWQNMARCTRVDQRGDSNVWIVLEQVPEQRSSTKSTKNFAQYVLPGFTQHHEVTMRDDKHPTCTCPEYTQGYRMCCAVCAVLCRLNRGADYKKVSMLHDLWDIRNHPLFPLAAPNVAFTPYAAIEVQLPQPVRTFILSKYVYTYIQQVTSTSMQPVALARLDQLSVLFKEVWVPSAACPSHYTTLRSLLLYQKQILSGQNPEQHPALFAPQMQVTMAQSNAQQGPASAAVQLSRLGGPSPKKRSSPSAAKYNPQDRHRVHTAQSRDPTSYSLHKRAIEGAQITCDCGESLINTKRTRYYHVHNNKRHLEWLKELNNQATNAQADSDVRCNAPTSDILVTVVDDAQGSDADGNADDAHNCQWPPTSCYFCVYSILSRWKRYRRWQRCSVCTSLGCSGK